MAAELSKQWGPPLYQAITGPEEEQKIFRKFSPDFFDLVVVDECHRGSAREDSAWREILEYFSSATQIGMTATPKETEYVSNIDYFGKPVYTYSLKQGIEDGFLAPYKVVRIDLDKDLSGWRPEKGKTDKLGQEIPDRVYNQRDFDRELVLEKRTARVAERTSEFLKGTNRYDKTIVFCEDIDFSRRKGHTRLACEGDPRCFSGELAVGLFSSLLVDATATDRVSSAGTGVRSFWYGNQRASDACRTDEPTSGATPGARAPKDRAKEAWSQEKETPRALSTASPCQD